MADVDKGEVDKGDVDTDDVDMDHVDLNAQIRARQSMPENVHVSIGGSGNPITSFR